MKDAEAATEFLARLQPLLEAGALRFEPRNRKTWEFMLEEGLGEEDAYDIIARLGPGHYEWGPRPDDNGTVGDVMLFSYPYTRLLASLRSDSFVHQAEDLDRCRWRYRYRDVISSLG